MGITMIVGGVFGTLTGVLLLNNLQNIGAIDNYLVHLCCALLELQFLFYMKQQK